MNDYDRDETGVLDALRDSMGEVTMGTPVEQVVAAGRARLRRRRLAGVAAVAAAVTGLALGVAAYANQSVGAPAAGGSNVASGVHVQTVAYTVESKPDGTVHVTWDKQRYIEDRPSRIRRTPGIDRGTADVHDLRAVRESREPREPREA